MKKSERAVLITLASEGLVKLQREQERMKCNNCMHYTPNGGRSPVRCLKWNATPPPEVLNVGCDEHEDDDIPF